MIFSDISRDLLDYCQAAAARAGQLSRCGFVLAPADNLAALRDSSVDVVTTRSVLIYVADKAAAFAEFRRLLRPGGRISLFEPINNLMRGCGSRLFFRLAEHAGFADVQLDLRVTVRTRRPAAPWDRFLRQSGNPNLPPLAEMLEHALSPAELAAFTAHLRPLVEAGLGESRTAVAYLTARDSVPDLTVE